MPLDRGKGREVHARAAHVGRHNDGGERYVTDAWILDLARDHLRKHPLDLGLDFSLALCHS
jgi:hypothetical protein